MKTMKLLISIFLVLSISLFSSCKEKTKKEEKWQDTITSGLIQIAADESFEPIIQEELDVFEALYTQAGVIPIYTSEVEALKLLIEDSVRFIVISKPLSDEEVKTFNSQKKFPRSIKIATDGVALIINKRNTDSIINIQTLEKIFTGEIKEWKQLNPESKLGKINVIFDNKNSGTVRYAIDSICHGKSLSPDLYAQTKNSEVVDFVNKDVNSLGIIGVNWVGNKNDSTHLSFHEKITVMSVSRSLTPDKSNSFKPYQYYLATGEYPMARGVFIILNDPKGGLSTGLTSFITDDRGQRIILKSGLLPATRPVNVRGVSIRDNF